MQRDSSPVTLATKKMEGKQLWLVCVCPELSHRNLHGGRAERLNTDCCCCIWSFYHCNSWELFVMSTLKTLSVICPSYTTLSNTVNASLFSRFIPSDVGLRPPFASLFTLEAKVFVSVLNGCTRRRGQRLLLFS